MHVAGAVKRTTYRRNVGRLTLGLALIAWTIGAGWLSKDIAAQEARSATALARDLLSNNSHRVLRAVYAFRRMPMEDWSPELRKALVDAVIQDTKAPFLPGPEQPLTGAMLELAEAGDPVVLPAIVLFPMSRTRVYETLFRFGQPRLEALLQEMSHGDMEDEAYESGLEALAYYANHWEIGAFDDATYAEIVGHASRVMESSTFRQTGRPLRAAILLASALQAPELVALLADLAESTETLRARGVAPGPAESLREAATAALAGHLTPFWQKFPGTTPQSRSPQALVRDFRSQDDRLMMHALAAFHRMPMEDRSPELRKALVDAVVQETKGPPVLAGPEQFAGLAETMLELGKACDPVVLPAIVLFPMGGANVYETLFRFGRPGLNALLQEMSEGHVESPAYRGGLGALAYFVDHWGVAAFDDATYGEIVGHAQRTLEFPYFRGSGWALEEAILLASLLDAPDLMALITDLASTEALRDRGVSEGYFTERTLEAAKEALAGRLVPFWRDSQRQSRKPQCEAASVEPQRSGRKLPAYGNPYRPYGFPYGDG